MVRTPLARRVPGHDVLNSVDCVLPHFDRTTAASVAKAMLGDREHDEDGTGGGEGRRVLVAPVDLEVNASVPEAVWEAFDELPSQTLPRKTARPVRRLAALALALSRDGLREGARKEAYRELFTVLDGLAARHQEEVAAARQQILEVEGETMVVKVGADEISEGEAFVEPADDRAVEAEFRAAGRVLTADLAREYAGHVAAGIASEDEEDDGLFDAHVVVAALSRVEEVAEELDREADKLAAKWFSEHRVAIKGLSDDRRTVYDEIKGMSPEPQTIGIQRPRVRTEETRDQDGNELETRTGHLMSDPNGEFPVGSLNQWEIAVLDREMARPDFLAWYRNPSRASADALAIAYRDAQGNWRRMCPDFLFFHGDEERVKVSIVDPHGHHLGDALPKLKGLAEFAAKHGDAFHRIESVTRMKDGTLRVLDLARDEVRKAVASAGDVEALYRRAREPVRRSAGSRR
jgi:type III restriction enzyme